MCVFCGLGMIKTNLRLDIACIADLKSVEGIKLKYSCETEQFINGICSVTISLKNDQKYISYIMTRTALKLVNTSLN